MRDEKLINQIMDVFSVLFEDYTYKLKEHVYDEETFGNSYTILQSDDLKIRIVNDREEILIQFSFLVDLDNWYGISVVLGYLGVNVESISYEQYKDITDRSQKLYAQLKDKADLLISNYDNICNIFRTSNFQNVKKGLDEYCMKIRNQIAEKMIAESKDRRARKKDQRGSGIPT